MTSSLSPRFLLISRSAVWIITPFSLSFAEPAQLSVGFARSPHAPLDRRGGMRIREPPPRPPPPPERSSAGNVLRCVL